MGLERLLVVSPLDVTGSPNSRTHHLVRHLAPHFRETFAISRRNASHLPRRERWSALFRMRTQTRQDGSIRWVALTHWGSIPHGLGHRLLGLSNPFSTPRPGPRRILRRVLSALGGLLELGYLPSLLATYFTRVGGRVDVAVVEGPWEAALGLLLRALGCVRVVVYDDLDFQPGFAPIHGLRRRLIATLERAGARRADLVISVGERLAGLRTAQGARLVRVVPNGVDVARFGVAHDARAKTGPRRPTLIYMGYLGAWAGVDLLLEALGLALRCVPDLRLILLGHGTPLDLAALESGIRTRGLAMAVEFRGEVAYEQLPAHLAEADVGLAMFRPLDLTRYAFPLKVVEYMAAGLPVLTTSDTEAADLVSRTGAGAAAPYDAAALAEAAVTLLQDPARRAEHSARAVQAAQAYEWGALMRQHLTAMRQIAGAIPEAQPTLVARRGADP